MWLKGGVDTFGNLNNDSANRPKAWGIPVFGRKNPGYPRNFKERGGQEIFDVTGETNIMHGRIIQTTITKYKTRGWFGEIKTKEKRRVTWRSPRPKGAWRVPFSFIDPVGRAIKESELTVSNDGTASITRQDGKRVWEVQVTTRGEVIEKGES